MDNQLNSEALSRITTEIFYTNGLLLAWGDRFPADLAAETALAILKKTLPQCPSVEKIVFCCYSPQDAERYRTLLERDGAVV